MDYEHVLGARKQRYRLQVLDHIERQLVEARIDGKRGAEIKQQRVAVRRRLGDSLGGDISGGSAAIIDYPLLTERGA